MSVANVSGSASSVPLGTIGRISSTGNSPEVVTSEQSKAIAARLLRWQLQGEAASLLPFEAVSNCLRRVHPLSSGAEIWREVGGECPRCRYGGLVRCHSVWLCPMCAWQIGEVRRRDLDKLITAASEQGVPPVFVTYTVRHHKWDRLSELGPRFRQAHQRVKCGRRYDALHKAFGIVGSVRGFEVTYGSNGFHPHMHELLFVPREVDHDALGVALRGQWFASAVKYGFDVSGDAQRYGFKIERTYGAIADYFTKYGHDPVYDLPWGISAEMTKGHMKRGRRGSDTPFSLLKRSYDGDTHAGIAFQEFGRYFKGQRQLWWSQGLRSLILGEDADGEVSDAEAVEPSPDDELLGVLSFDDWRKVRRHRARGELLEVAAVGGWSAVAEWLAAHD